MFVFPKFVPILHNDVLWKTRAQSSFQVHVNAGKSDSRPSDYKLSAPTKGLASRLSFSVSARFSTVGYKSSGKKRRCKMK